MCEYMGEHRFVSRASGDAYLVKGRKKRVDATYLEPSVPASYKPPFEIAMEARCIANNDLARIAERADGCVIVGAGKTAVDACMWLLEIGVSPDDTRRRRAMSVKCCADTGCRPWADDRPAVRAGSRTRLPRRESPWHDATRA